jgi:hypothetical protein
MPLAVAAAVEGMTGFAMGVLVDEERELTLTHPDHPAHPI